MKQTQAETWREWAGKQMTKENLAKGLGVAAALGGAYLMTRESNEARINRELDQAARVSSFPPGPRDLHREMGNSWRREYERQNR